ncbi:MAG: hypothetical protein Q8K89_09280 [Actinomycetota bacterium]|nr:hypothetical protein [Actinomycetota bacterium]
MRLRRTLVLLLCVVLVLGLQSPGTALAVKTIALSSGSFSFEIDPAMTGSGEVEVINDGDEDIKVLVYVADVEINDKGEQSFPLPSREGASIFSSSATWMRVYMPADSKAVGNTPYLELAPEQRVLVKFDFSPPRDATPGDHNVVMFFEMFDFLPESAGSASQVSGRIGARVQLRVKGQFVERLEVRPFEVPSFVIGNVIPYKFSINNEGNVNERTAGTIALLDRNERELVSAEVASDTPVYAGASLEISGEMTTVASALGPQTVEMRLQYFEQGATSPTEVVTTRTVWMVPLWLLIALAVALFALVIWLGARAARRRERLRRRRERPLRAPRDDSHYEPEGEPRKAPEADPAVQAPNVSEDQDELNFDSDPR